MYLTQHEKQACDAEDADRANVYNAPRRDSRTVRLSLGPSVTISIQDFNVVLGVGFWVQFGILKCILERIDHAW